MIFTSTNFFQLLVVLLEQYSDMLVDEPAEALFQALLAPNLEDCRIDVLPWLWRALALLSPLVSDQPRWMAASTTCIARMSVPDCSETLKSRGLTLLLALLERRLVGQG